MKYTVTYGARSEQTNNKAQAIKWANECMSPATVFRTENGDILHENAAQRRINHNLTKLHKIAAAAKAGMLLIK